MSQHHASAAYDAEPVRRLVNPYPWQDYVRVVKRNLTQRPVTKHRGLTRFIESDTTLDERVEPAATIGFLGDVMPVRGRRFELSDELAAFLAGCTHLVVNFEGVLWHGEEPPPKVLAVQRHHDLRVLETLAAVVSPEQIVVTVANNHAADYGYEEHLRTVADLESLGVDVIGTLERPSTRVAGGINVAAVTQWTNQRHTYLPFLADHVRHLDHDARFQLLVPHMGLEMETHPRPASVETGRRLLDHWDAVVGHHPHVPNPVTVEPARGADRLLAYSLGQAASDIRYPIYRYGIALRVGIGPCSAAAPTSAVDGALGQYDGGPGEGGPTWSVGDVSWRFLALDQSDPGAVRAELRPTNRYFPGITAAVESS